MLLYSAQVKQNTFHLAQHIGLPSVRYSYGLHAQCIFYSRCFSPSPENLKKNQHETNGNLRHFILHITCILLSSVIFSVFDFGRLWVHMSCGRVGMFSDVNVILLQQVVQETCLFKNITPNFSKHGCGR